MIQAGPFRQRDNVVSHQWDNSPRPTSGTFYRSSILTTEPPFRRKRYMVMAYRVVMPFCCDTL